MENQLINNINKINKISIISINKISIINIYLYKMMDKIKKYGIQNNSSY